MIDNLDARLHERFAANADTPPVPVDWNDVVRRAADVRPRRGLRPVRTRRRVARLGLAAVGLGTAGVLGALLLVGGGEQPTAAIGDDQEIRTVHSRTTLHPGDGPITFDMWIDLERRRARAVFPAELSTREDPVPLETITTPDRTYALVPPGLRTRSDGKPWISVRTDAEDLAGTAAFFDVDRYTKTSPEDFAGGPGATFVREGTEKEGGVLELTKYRVATPTTGPQPGGGAPVTHVWLDRLGRLRRMTLTDATAELERSEVVTFNEPFDIETPPPGDVYEVPTDQAADDILRPSS